MPLHPSNETRLAPRRAVASVALLAVFALVLGGVAQAADPSNVAQNGGQAFRHFPAPPAPTIRTRGRRPALAAGQTYAIADVGGPYPTFETSMPYAFNDSGQLFGYAFSQAKGVQDCVVYAAGKFVDVSAATSFGACFPAGMNTQSASGVVSLVGYVSTPFDEGPVGFIATVTTAKTVLTQFSSHSPSAVTGVNSSGEAIGNAYYEPVGGFFSTYPEFVVVANSKALSLAQPACTTKAQYCANEAQGTFTTGCAFGGCFINDTGTILAVDAYNNDDMIYAYGGSTPNDLPTIPAAYLAGGQQINNAGQILYSAYDKAFGHITSAVYSVATGTTTAIPTIAGNTCAYYYGLSLSNGGQVLGYTGKCTNAADLIYWTWDPVHGTQNLNAEIASNTYAGIDPLGVNDSGQILVSLISATTGLADWGTLDPPAQPKSLRHR